MKPIVKSLVPNNYWFPVLLTEDRNKYGGMLPIKMVSLRSTSPAATGTGYCDASGNSTHPDFLKFLTLSGTSVNPGKSTVNYAFMKNNFAGTTASDVFYASAVSATVPAGAVRNQILAKDGTAKEYRNVSGFNGKSWKLYSDALTLKYSNAPFGFDYTTNNPDEAFAIEGGESCIRNIRCEIHIIPTYDDYVVCQTGEGQKRISLEITKTLKCLENFPLECCKEPLDAFSMDLDMTLASQQALVTGTNPDGTTYTLRTLTSEIPCKDIVCMFRDDFYGGLRRTTTLVRQDIEWSENNVDEFTRLPGESCCAEFVDQFLYYRMDMVQNYAGNTKVGDTSATETFVVDGSAVEISTSTLANASGSLSSALESNTDAGLMTMNCGPQNENLGTALYAYREKAGKSFGNFVFYNILVTNIINELFGGTNQGYCKISSCLPEGVDILDLLNQPRPLELRPVRPAIRPRPY